MEADEDMPPPPRQRRASAVSAALAIALQEEKIVDPPVEKKKKPQRPIEIDVGPVNVELKSLLRRPSVNQKLAKKVKQKYSTRVKFHGKCSIAVISPLPGWSSTKLRLDYSDEEEEEEPKVKKELFPKTTLTNNLMITPLSMKKLEKMEVNGPLVFNATMVFGDEAQPREEPKKKRDSQKKRRQSQLMAPVHLSDDSLEPVEHQQEEKPELDRTIERMAAQSDPNLEDSQSSAHSCDSLDPAPVEHQQGDKSDLDRTTERMAAQSDPNLEDSQSSAQSCDSLDPARLEHQQEEKPKLDRTIERIASKSEDSQSSAQSCDEAMTTAIEPLSNVVHIFKAGRAANWLSNGGFMDRSHDSTLDRDDILFRAAVGSSSTSSMETDSEEFKKPEGRMTRSRKSMAPQKPAPASPPDAPVENIPPKVVVEKPPAMNSFFLPRAKKTMAGEEASTETSSESAKAKASRRKSVAPRKDAGKEKKPSPPPEPKPKETKVSKKKPSPPPEPKEKKVSNRRKSCFVKPQEEEETDDIVEVPVTKEEEKLPKTRKRKSVFVDSRSKKALLTSEEEVVAVEVAVKEQDDKKWKKVVHWNELDHAPVPKLHHTAPIRLFELGETEHLPEPRMRIKLPRPVPVVAGPFPANPDARPLRHMLFHRKTDEAIEEIVEEMDDEQRRWFDRLKTCDPSAPWTEAFCPKESSSWLGNPEVARQTRDFVARWKKRVVREESEAKKKEGRKKKAHSDDSDYEEEDSPIYENPLILCGPTGSGKTALIASVASELNMKILEVQPGDKRNGASLRQKLAGAGQSHLVQAGPSIASFFGGKKPAAPASDPSPKQKMQTLIVVEHVDVHFPDEDKDFWSALKDLAAEAKVPVIWTCERFPAAELRREPAYDNWCQQSLHYNSVATVAGYVRCCLLAAKRVDIAWEDLKAFVQAYNCDLRAILANLQIQLASAHENSIFFPPMRRPSPARANAQESLAGYRTQQEALAAKRLQYQAIVRAVEQEREAKYCQQRAMIQGQARLNDARSSMGILEPFRGLAISTVPYLVQMDAAERLRAQNSRRYQHYFNIVHGRHNNRQIDADGRLIPIVRQFSMPQ